MIKLKNIISFFVTVVVMFLIVINFDTIKDVLKNIYETIDLFIEMQREFWERRNYGALYSQKRKWKLWYSHGIEGYYGIFGKDWGSSKSK